MSTSDAVHLEVTVRSEAATPSHRQPSCHETSHPQHSSGQAFICERTPQALIFGAHTPAQEENVKCGSSYTTCIVLTRIKKLDVGQPQIRLKRKQDTCVYRSSESQRSQIVGGISQVNEPNTFTDNSRELSPDSRLPVKIQFLSEKDEDIIRVFCTSRKSRSNLPCGSQPRTELEQTTKDSTKLQKQTDFEEHSQLNDVMLSSAMVTVIAPTWSGRLRRSKKLEATGSLDTLENLPGVGNSEAARPQDYTRGCQSAMGSVSNISTQSRAPFTSTRQNTRSWSIKSGPQNLKYEAESKVNQTVSLDGRSPNIKKAEASTTWNQYGQKRNPQDCPQVQRASLSSKPTTSSLLLALRRINNQNMNSNIPTPSEVTPVPIDRDQDLQKYTTNPAQPTHKTLERERFKSLPSSLSISSKTSETQPANSLSLVKEGKRETMKTSLFTSTNTNKVISDTPKQPQMMNREQPSLLGSRQAIFISRSSEKEQNWRGSGRSLNIFSDKALLSHKTIQHESNLLSESDQLPRNTSGASNSRWQQIGEKGKPTPVLTDTPNVKNKPNTPLIPLGNNSCDTPTLGLTNTKSLNCQISPNSNTKESVCNGSINSVMKPQKGGSTSSQEKHIDYSLDKVRFAKQLHESSLKRLETLKSQSLLDAQPATSHQSDSMKHDISNGSFQAHISNLSTPLFNPNNPVLPETKNRNTPFSLNYAHKSKSIKLCSSIDSTKTLKNQVVVPIVSGFPHNQNTCPPLQSKPDSSQTNLGTSLISSKVPTSKIPNTVSIATTNSPLGFIGSYSPSPKPFQTKTLSCLNPMTNESIASMSTSPSTETTPAHNTSAHAMTSHLQTSSASPPSPNKVGGILTNRSEKDNKKSGPGQGKRVKHVMWEDSENFEPTKNPDTPVLTSPISRSMSQRLLRAPSIFSFLRLGSQNTKNTPLTTTSSKTSSLQLEKGEKYRLLSSNFAERASREEGESQQNLSDVMSFDQDRKDSPPCRLQRSLSLQSGEFLRHTTALAPFSDFSNGYKIRYSPPPYSTLLSNRGESKKANHRIPLFQNPNLNSNHTPDKPLQPESDVTSINLKSSVKNSLKGWSPTLQKKIALHEKASVSTDDINNNNYNSLCRNQQNDSVPVESGVSITSQSLQNSKMYTSPSAPKNARAESMELFRKTVSAVEARPNEQSHKTLTHSDQNSSGSSSSESRSVSDEVSNKKMKETVMGKLRLFSAENNNEQSPNIRSLILKKSFSMPSSEPEKANKTSNKVDQVISLLRNTFSTKRPGEELASSKWRQASEKPSVCKPSDSSNIHEATMESHRTVIRDEQQTRLLENKPKRSEEWAQNPYSIIPALSVQNSTEENEYFIYPDRDKLNIGAKELPDQNSVEKRGTDKSLLCLDPSLSTKSRKSTSSPKSPFSIFSSLSTHSPFSSPDTTNDNVFYSPKIQRRIETSSPCEPAEGIGLMNSRRSRVSVGTPSIGHVQDEAYCYADLKYGIEPGKSVSVSSVLSSRPSRSGRISTGPRFMSVGDLSESIQTHGQTDEDFQHWLEKHPNHKPMSKIQSYFPNDNMEARSRSLPRSLTRRLAHWSSGVSVCPPAGSTSPLSPHHWSPKMNTCQFEWDLVSPPTPPPTPPLSPQPRRMSKPPSLSSPNFSSSPKPSSFSSPNFSSSPTNPSLSSPNFSSSPVELMDNHSPRGHLPSRGYISSLSTFEESSDSSSDTTTDDEYYFEKSDDEEKETEL
ncbi:uncharacterized protein LOC144209769 isoform X2 [Stigmatopora nigra]